MKSAQGENSQCTYAAFLRGINVGGRSPIRMDDLRKAFESAGFLNVKTVLTSGNVLFRAPEEGVNTLAMKISRELKEAFGRDIFVIVRSLDDLRELVDSRPFKGVEEEPGARLFVTFFLENAGRGNMPLPVGEKGYRILSVAGGVVCSVLYERPGARTAGMMAAIEKEFGQKVTTRSWNTVVRLVRPA